MKKELYVVNSIYKYHLGKFNPKLENKKKTSQMSIVRGRHFRIETMKK